MKNSLYLFFTLCLLLPFSGIAQNDNLAKANKYYELHAYEDAIDLYKKILSTQPANVEVLSKLADSYRLINDMKNAATYFKKADSQPQRMEPEYMRNYGHVLKSLARYDDARSQYYTYAKHQPAEGNHFAESCNKAKEILKIKGRYQVSREYMNTTAADFAPSFYNSKVIYASSRTDIKNSDGSSSKDWTGAAYNQLFITQTDKNNKLQNPELLLKNIKTEFNQGPVTYDEEGEEIIFAKNNFVNGTRPIPEAGLKMDLYIGKVTNMKGNWEEPKPFPYNDTKYSVGYPCLSEDGQTLYFASNRPGGMGGYDIYVSYRNGGEWSTPKNLGSEVNTPGNELSPFISGRTLYFASDWHHGLGGLDMFECHRDNGSWKDIKNMGLGINSTQDDFGLIYNKIGNIGYFVSNREEGKGNEDIYSFIISYRNLEVMVMDEAGNPLREAQLDFFKCGSGMVLTDANGRVALPEKLNKNCEVTISKSGYVNRTIALSEVTNDIRLSRDGEIPAGFSGYVKNAKTEIGVHDVAVTAINENTQEKLDTKTDINGKYSLDLNPENTYVIKFSKIRYTDTYKKYKTDANEKHLGTMLLQPSVTSDVAEVKPVSVPKESGEGSEELVAKGGFYVQLGAYSKVDETQFDEIKAFGDVSFYESAGLKIYRIGKYDNEGEARQIQKKVIEAGFNDAYIKRVTPKKPAPSVADKEPVEAPPKAGPDVKLPETEEQVFYSVQVGFGNPKYFNKGNLAETGTVYTVEKEAGKFSFLVGKYKEIENARAAQKFARENGYPGAFIVGNKNGKVVSLGEMTGN